MGEPEYAVFLVEPRSKPFQATYWTKDIGKLLSTDPQGLISLTYAGQVFKDEHFFIGRRGKACSKCCQVIPDIQLIFHRVGEEEGVNPQWAGGEGSGPFLCIPLNASSTTLKFC